MTNSTLRPGYYWVQEFRNSETMTIAKLTKNSGWRWFEPTSSLLKMDGKTRISNKRPEKPAQVIMRCVTPDMVKYMNPLADCHDWVVKP